MACPYCKSKTPPLTLKRLSGRNSLKCRDCSGRFDTPLADDVVDDDPPAAAEPVEESLAGEDSPAPEPQPRGRKRSR
jgi:DNA-directed RNA polymerase subunit RPC12/RpoP